MSTRNEKTVRNLWLCFSEGRWREAETLLAPELTVDWQQSNERIIGPKNFIAINEFYGGTHQIEVKKTTAVGDQVISEVFIQSQMPDGRQLRLFALSFFTFREEKISHIREYWADTYPAPENRKQWVTPLSSG